MLFLEDARGESLSQKVVRLLPSYFRDSPECLVGRAFDRVVGLMTEPYVAGIHVVEAVYQALQSHAVQATRLDIVSSWIEDYWFESPGEGRDWNDRWRAQWPGEKEAFTLLAATALLTAAQTQDWDTAYQIFRTSQALWPHKSWLPSYIRGASFNHVLRDLGVQRGTLSALLEQAASQASGQLDLRLEALKVYVGEYTRPPEPNGGWQRLTV